MKQQHNTPKPEDQITGDTMVFDGWRARPLKKSDAATAFSFLNDDGVVLARNPPPPATIDEAAAWIEDALSDPACVPWLLERDDGTPAGFIALQSLDLDAGSSEVGCLVIAGHRQQGLATAALRAVSTWTFDNLDVHRLYLVHDTDNIASCRAATSVGYQVEGICRAARRGPNGTRLDSELHSLLRTDCEQQP